MKAFVYILQDEENRYYIGSTLDIGRRMKQHSSGHTLTTKRMTNAKLVFSQEFKDLNTARKMERRLKNFKRKDFIAKIVKDGFIKIQP